MPKSSLSKWKVGDTFDKSDYGEYKRISTVTKIVDTDEAITVNYVTLTVLKNKETFETNHSKTSKKYLVVNGALRGKRITLEDAPTNYFQFNNSSYSGGYGKHKSGIPSSVLVYIGPSK